MEGFVNGPSQALDDSPFGPLLLYFGFLDGRTSMDIVIYPLREKAPKVLDNEEAPINVITNWTAGIK
jgi:hypothetical protein